MGHELFKALKSVPKEDNRAAANSIAMRAAGSWVSNAEVRGKVIFEELVKNEASVKERWDMTKDGVFVINEERGGKCDKLVPNGKTFINFTQKKSAFIPYKKGEPPYYRKERRRLSCCIRYERSFSVCRRNS